ncbi:hypothetical protein DM02DRAFT_409906 [Periconia macrospinosa]|uniref:FAD/NAD(P)-binding domain-containing protein n=1 Tax=Periconia macrospinosa TaxID=97972 RepID=A0A2V1DS16_9PLEO|nr:hypothetical protein DM02DRAFT_409906 [Periconia macrospinosa]
MSSRRSTGLQIAQTIVDSVDILTVFQRTSNLALFFLHEELVREEEEKRKHQYPEQFKQRLRTFAGYPYDTIDKDTFDDIPEQREAFYEELWKKGGFYFWLATYHDMLSNIDANNAAYDFWKKKVRARIHDPAVAEVLAPSSPPHPFGTKRPALECRWFDMFNDKHVNIVDLRTNGVDHVTKTGIVTEDGKHHNADIIALATGFDAITGGINAIDIRSASNRALRDKWSEEGVRTSLGMMVVEFPNMFMLYGPQGPTAFANGPSCVEIQGNWLTDTIVGLQTRGTKRIEPLRASEEEWTSRIEDDVNKTLFPLADSWYMGANIPGKRRQMLNFVGGIPAYAEALEDVTKKGFEGFKLSPTAENL